MAGHRLAKILISRSSWFESLSNLGSMVNSPKCAYSLSVIKCGHELVVPRWGVFELEDKLARFNIQSTRNKTRHFLFETANDCSR